MRVLTQDDNSRAKEMKSMHAKGVSFFIFGWIG